MGKWWLPTGWGNGGGGGACNGGIFANAGGGFANAGGGGWRNGSGAWGNGGGRRGFAIANHKPSISRQSFYLVSNGGAFLLLEQSGEHSLQSRLTHYPQKKETFLLDNYRQSYSTRTAY